jgi:hypothetical protein
VRCYITAERPNGPMHPANIARIRIPRRETHPRHLWMKCAGLQARVPLITKVTRQLKSGRCGTPPRHRQDRARSSRRPPCLCACVCGVPRVGLNLESEGGKNEEKYMISGGHRSDDVGDWLLALLPLISAIIAVVGCCRWF